jgi:hypothetical protein
VPATPESQARTRAFARVIGPWLVIVPGIIALRAPGMAAFASEFFKSALFVWFAGALLLFGGLLIIAFHQYWSSVAAVLISVFGWILALRGLMLMAAPELYERAATLADSTFLVRLYLRCTHRNWALPHLRGLAHQACFSIGREQPLSRRAIRNVGVDRRVGFRSWQKVCGAGSARYDDSRSSDGSDFT